MPVRFLSDAVLARLGGWPDAIADDDLNTFFILTADDLGWLGSNVRVENRLGAAVQLCALPWLGWIPDDLAGCPVAAAERLADQFGLANDEVPGLLAAYGGWEGRTRRDHRALVLDRLGWRLSAGDRKQLDGFLLARALEHDAPGVLFRLACDWLRSEQIFRPSVDTLARRVAAARDGARAETYSRLAPLLASPRPGRLDRLLDFDAHDDQTRLLLPQPRSRPRPHHARLRTGQARTARPHVGPPTFMSGEPNILVKSLNIRFVVTPQWEKIRQQRSPSVSAESSLR